MCKVVTMLSKDTVEHLLLPRFCDLCSDARLFQVRKVRTSKNIFHAHQTSQYLRLFFVILMDQLSRFIPQSQLSKQPLSNLSMSLFSLGIHSITQHVSLNSVVCIKFAHTMLLFPRGMLMFSYWCWLGKGYFKVAKVQKRCGQSFALPVV